MSSSAALASAKKRRVEQRVNNHECLVFSNMYTLDQIRIHIQKLS